MSAHAAPKAPAEAPEPAGPEDEGWALLENLRRRLEDQATQGRRTQQQVSQLAESIGALVEVQRRRSRWLNLNSFVAYLIFTMLCGAGFYLLYQSRAGALARGRDAAQRDRDAAVRRADEAVARAAAREQADASAWEVYQLLQGGKRTEAEARLAALGELPLSRTERAILAARVHETQVMAVDAALRGAAASFKAGRQAEVIAPLEAALVTEPTGARAVLMRYYLGVAYAKASQLEKASAHLQAAVDGNTDQEDARFQLASVLDRSGAYARARAEYERFATARPQSPLAVFAMRRAATLALLPPVAPGAPAAADATVVPRAIGAPPGPVAPVPPAGAAPFQPSPSPVPPAGAAPFRPSPVLSPSAGTALPPAGAAIPPRPAPAPAGALQPQPQPAVAPSPKAPLLAPAGAPASGAATPPSPSGQPSGASAPSAVTPVQAAPVAP